MKHSRINNAHAVILPAFATTVLSDATKRFLANGGCSIVLGETRAEYVAREVSRERKATESSESILRVTREANNLAGDVLVAVDQELCGICRLHNLVPSFPEKEELVDMESLAVEEIAKSVAVAARKMGVNCFLAPILDVVTGENPWLKGRTWSTDTSLISILSSAYIRGIQSAGVCATAKHFPGYHNIPLDPAVEAEAKVIGNPEQTIAGLKPFSDAIEHGVDMIMLGPAIVESLDTEYAASISTKIVTLLKKQLHFKGVVMTDVLDAAATLGGRGIEDVAVQALNAGADLLLLADKDDQIERVVNKICQAVERDELVEERLNAAASLVRTLVANYSLNFPKLLHTEKIL